MQTAIAQKGDQLLVNIRINESTMTKQLIN